jgi:hypothetical protein
VGDRVVWADPIREDIVQLVVSGGGQVYLRSEIGGLVNQGNLRDGMVTWGNGKRSGSRAGPGVLVGDRHRQALLLSAQWLISSPWANR